MDENYVKKIKFDIVYDPMIQKSNLSILESTLFVLHIEALFDSLLYTNFIVVLLMPLLIIVQLFIDGSIYSMLF
jgi:hypothetical protein